LGGAKIKSDKPQREDWPFGWVAEEGNAGPLWEGIPFSKKCKKEWPVPQWEEWKLKRTGSTSRASMKKSYFIRVRFRSAGRTGSNPNISRVEQRMGVAEYDIDG